MKYPKYNHLGHLLCLAFECPPRTQIIRIESHYAKKIKVEAIHLTTPPKRTAGGSVLRRTWKKEFILKDQKVINRLRKLLNG